MKDRADQNFSTIQPKNDRGVRSSHADLMKVLFSSSCGQSLTSQ